MSVDTEHLPVRTGDRRGVDAGLAATRVGVRRYDPHEVLAAAARGALVVDTRTEPQRRAQGELPGALAVDGNSATRTSSGGPCGPAAADDV